MIDRALFPRAQEQDIEHTLSHEQPSSAGSMG